MFCFLAYALIEEGNHLNLTDINPVMAAVTIRPEGEFNDRGMIDCFAKYMAEIFSKKKLTLEIDMQQI